MNHSLLEDLSALDQLLSRPVIPKAQRNWGGAGTVVSDEEPKLRSGPQFYPDPRYVVTCHHLELSWLIEQLRDIFMNRQLIDFETKSEFFGRLCNAANLCLQENQRVSSHILCAAVLHEAYSIAVDLDSGEFQWTRIAFSGEIADDFVEPFFRPGFLSIDSTLDFFRARGLTVFGTA